MRFEVTVIVEAGCRDEAATMVERALAGRLDVEFLQHRENCLRQHTRADGCECQSWVWHIADPNGQDIGEGPWATEEEAREFLDNEVGLPHCDVGRY